MRYAIIPAAFAAAMFSGLHVHAVEVGLTLFQESEYTTNSARTETDEVEEWIL